MKQLSLLAILVLMGFFACQQQPAPADAADTAGIALFTQVKPELSYKNLRLYPITADAGFIKGNERAAQYISLSEAIKNSRFRITEHKPYGRFEDAAAVNTLTVQNKSTDTVFLMAGDIVQGGNQDRVIAQDMVFPPRTITDIPVFCVEPGRWAPNHQEDGDGNLPEKNKRIYAFTGYYNVAASGIRQTVKHSKDQQEVWDKVGQVTSAHHAQAATGAYAALEQSDSFTASRDAYLHFFEDKFADAENVVGVVAVSGHDVIGADIFAHPGLFKKLYPSLLHSYITDAITYGAPVEVTDNRMEHYAAELLKDFMEPSPQPESKYVYRGMMVHFTSF
ncbi:MAG: hypothetical protein H6564_17530 [Lewinellaceae bacterium]|nr:hypothetical protein [Lewinellaceae bacterium]